ncbi:helix-turn-helix domain-containing protein [Burkholderia gladioli]|uniref:helix-turn-helix domain-containing protein n=1 Tax=Burkholderia gladioli TaxID=28095 RepID=UPI001641D340|nr:helix-turn-helix transcriptional regulator [Burkholderia gladioli]
MNETESMGERIILARAAMGWSQAELAQRVGVAATQVARWERGKATPRAETAHKLATLLDVSPRWLTLGEGSAKEDELWDELDPQVRELIANFTDDEQQLLRRQAKASGRTLPEQLEFIATEFTERWERSRPPPGWMKLKLSESLEDRLIASAKKNGRSLNDEITARLTLSLDAEEIEHEAPLRKRPLPEGVVIDHGVKVWAQRLLKPGNRHELESLLAAIRFMFDGVQ